MNRVSIQERIFMSSKKNERFMRFVHCVHGLLENDDMQRQRDSQNQLGNLMENEKLHISF